MLGMSQFPLQKHHSLPRLWKHACNDPFCTPQLSTQVWSREETLY